MLIPISLGRQALLWTFVTTVTVIWAVCLWAEARPAGFEGLDSLRTPYAIQATQDSRYAVSTQPGQIKVYLLEGDLHIRANSQAPLIEVFAFGDSLSVEEGEHFISTGQGRLEVRSRLPRRPRGGPLGSLGMHE